MVSLARMMGRPSSVPRTALVKPSHVASRLRSRAAAIIATWTLAGCAPTAPAAPPPPRTAPNPGPRVIPKEGRGAAIVPAPAMTPAEFVDLARPGTSSPIPPTDALALDVRRVSSRGAHTFLAIDAPRPSDVWLLDVDGKLFRGSSGGITRQPMGCAGDERFGPRALRVDDDQVRLAGAKSYETSGVPRIVASFAERVAGTWRCRDYPAVDSYVFSVDMTLVPGAAWAVEHMGDDVPLRTWTSDGEPMTVPPLLGHDRPPIWRMTDRRRGWFVGGACDDETCREVGHVWESRGAGWFPRPGLGDVGVADLWVDDESTAWVAGTALAWFRDGRWHRVALPEGFVALHVAGSGPNDVWLASETELMRFDGTRLERAPAPISRIRDIRWVEGQGLWVIGGPEPEYGEESRLPTVGEAVVVTRAKGRAR